MLNGLNGIFQYNALTLLAYGFLYLTVALLWMPVHVKKLPIWLLSCVFTLILAVVDKRISSLGVFSVFLFSFVVYGFRYALLRGNGFQACAYPGTASSVSDSVDHRSQKVKYPVLYSFLLGAMIFLLGLALAGHLMPGFHNLKVIDRLKITTDAVPFSLYLNADKTMVGIFIIGFLHQRITQAKDWLALLKCIAPRAALLFLIISGLSLALGFVRFDPKIPSHLGIWMMTNLLFVCVAEEGLFRGFLQRYLCCLWSKTRLGSYLAISISAVLFGLIHYAGGPIYVILATISGLGYGWIYYRSGRIEGSILTHFTLNLIHILFFTYPALASGVR